MLLFKVVAKIVSTIKTLTTTLAEVAELKGRDVKDSPMDKHLQEQVWDQHRQVGGSSLEIWAFAQDDVLHEPVQVLKGFQAVSACASTIHRVTGSVPVLDN